MSSSYSLFPSKSASVKTWEVFEVVVEERAENEERELWGEASIVLRIGRALLTSLRRNSVPQTNEGAH